MAHCIALRWPALLGIAFFGVLASAAVTFGFHNYADAFYYDAGPVVSAPTITGDEVGQTITFTVSATDAMTDVGLCSLYIDAALVGPMTYNGSTFSYSMVATTIGSFSAFAVCLDTASNSTTGATTVYTIAEATPAAEEEAVEDEEEETAPEVTEASPGSLIKTTCDETVAVDVNDPCKAVYYYDMTTGNRHAFPNEKVYFTWYSDFDTVVEVSQSFMASLTLGTNVTYHPGTRMVKFVTVNTVYAVGETGELRAIDSEETATALYGSTWNQQIDDISDAFFGNYSFGDGIDDASDFDADAVAAIVTTIDDIL